MEDSSHGSAYLLRGPDSALDRDRFFLNPAVSVGDQGVVPRRRAGLAVSRAPSAWGKAGVDAGRSGCLNTAVRLPGHASRPGQRAAAAGSRGAKRRRRAVFVEWLDEVAAAPAVVPMWTSRRGWIDEVRHWAQSAAFRPVCAAQRVSMTAATLVAIVRVWAESADHRTGRNAAVTKGRIAATVGCDAKTVQRAWVLLRAGGFAIEASRGHGSPIGHSAGNRPSVWHLISPRRAARREPDSVDVVPLPSLPKGERVSLVGEISPRRARTRATPRSAPRNSSTKAQTPRSGRRNDRPDRGPRPLAAQKLAAKLAVLCHGLDHGPNHPQPRHMGALVDAVLNSSLDTSAWTAEQLRDALNANMQATGWFWPNQVSNPAAFLAYRLRALPTVPPPVAATPMPARFDRAEYPPMVPASEEVRVAAREQVRAVLGRSAALGSAGSAGVAGGVSSVRPAVPASSVPVGEGSSSVSRWRVLVEGGAVAVSAGSVGDGRYVAAAKPPVVRVRASSGRCWQCGADDAPRVPKMPERRAFWCASHQAAPAGHDGEL